jgi:hypothetical protein
VDRDLREGRRVCPARRSEAVVPDAGPPLGVGVLIDRLVATLIGAALVIAANLIFARAAAAPATPA